MHPKQTERNRKSRTKPQWRDEEGSRARGKKEDCDVVISVHFYLMNTWLTYYADGTRANGFLSEWLGGANLLSMEKSEQADARTGKEDKILDGGIASVSVSRQDRLGFLSINALVSSWKWNNKWAFRTLSGLFHAWMFSLNFSVNPLGKQWGMAGGEWRREGVREQHAKTQTKRYKVERKRGSKWKKRWDRLKA